MKCQQLFDTIDTLNDRYLSIWEEVCNIESPTHYKPGVDAVGKYLADVAAQHGWQVEKFAQPVAGDVWCITMNPDANAPAVCISGHMDTVHAVGSFGTPAVRRDHEKMYGPGVEDCKGGIVAGVMAMDALQRCGFTQRPVRLLLQSDEESGSSLSNKATIQYICKKAEGAVAFLNLEGATNGEACLVRKGIITFHFEITGQEAHASNCAKAGANAIAEAAYKIIELEKIKDDDGLTCNCGVISGGSVPNTVPGFCQFKVNVRFATAEQLEWIREYAQKVADTVYVPGCSCKLTVATWRPAMECTQRNVDLLDAMNRIYAENGMPQLTISKHKGGSDAADVTAYGIPCVDSIGVVGGGIHSPKEFSWLSSLSEAAKRVAAVIYCI